MKIILLLFILCFKQLHAENTRSISLGGIASTPMGAYALFTNPAGISLHRGLFAISSVSNFYLINALSEKHLGLGFVRKNVGLGASISQLGDHRLSKTKSCISYSQKFGTVLSLGIRVNVIQWSFSDIYGSKYLFFSTIGCITQISKSLSLSCLIDNPGRHFIDKEELERTDGGLAFGLMKVFSKQFSIRTEIEHRTSVPTNLKMGLEYASGKHLTLRTGFESAYRRFTAGFECSFLKLNLDVAFSYEYVLGYRSSIGIIYQLENSSK